MKDVPEEQHSSSKERSSHVLEGSEMSGLCQECFMRVTCVVVHFRMEMPF